MKVRLKLMKIRSTILNVSIKLYSQNGFVGAKITEKEIRVIFDTTFMYFTLIEALDKSTMLKPLEEFKW